MKRCYTCNAELSGAWTSVGGRDFCSVECERLKGTRQVPPSGSDTVVRTGPSINKGKSKQDYGTPWEFIRAVVQRFGPLDFDLAASSENKKADAFFSEADDSLSQDWTRLEGNLWLNPPFANIAAWAEKCALTATRRRGFILFLTPASVGANWFADHVHRKALVLGLSPRLTFEGTSDPYPKDLILSVYGYGASGFDTWRWK